MFSMSKNVTSGRKAKQTVASHVHDERGQEPATECFIALFEKKI